MILTSLRPFGKLRMSITYHYSNSSRCVRRTPLAKSFHTSFFTKLLMFLQWSKNVALGLRTVFATRGTRRARRPGPQKPPFLACQKVAPPPCKKCTKSAFPGRKAGIFDRFVHEIAHFWHLFCGHSSRPMGCQSVGKKPANLYSTKCRIFGPRTPPPVAPWWDTSSRRPRTGSRTPFSYFAINCKNEKSIFGVGFLLRHFFV
jgi:hypothetical protein